MSMAAREAAGCVVLRQLQGGLQVLLIRLKNRDDPRLPKGGVEDGESYEQCAVREVEEETGYQVRLLPYEPVVVEAVKNKRLPVLHLTIRFFLASALDGSPDKRKDRELVSRVDWVPVQEAVGSLRFPEEKEALEECLKLFSAQGLAADL
ncbi:NUDIX domain-containing protein [Paenibacillus aurantius]|uniref:NUDIX domain-containing protein n=1 Tax=Paenibacillus aurantius TaxID=2918900 RepID=A0AA96RG84_9BACL|nr:NUDIX domain-containing protein [Paenibacillus aurantius]WNQ09779.1 NUDIX domain-containing protein [Paenibacillus aurantius]